MVWFAQKLPHVFSEFALPCKKFISVPGIARVKSFGIPLSYITWILKIFFFLLFSDFDFRVFLEVLRILTSLCCTHPHSVQ